MKPITDTKRDDPNDHYGTRNHKYTINIPLELMRQAQIKSKAAGFNEVAPYFRLILSREVMSGTLRISDILGEKEALRQEYLQKVRRENENSKFCKVSTKNFLDKIRNLMVNFKRNKDQLVFEF